MIYNNNPIERINNGQAAYVWLSTIRNNGIEFRRNKAGMIVMRDYVLTMDDQMKTHRRCTFKCIISDGEFTEAYENAMQIVMEREREMMKAFDKISCDIKL